MILAVDPGTRESGLVELQSDGTVSYAGHEPNADLLQRILRKRHDIAVFEKMAYARTVGAETIDTIWWTGAFCLTSQLSGIPFGQVTRNDVKMTLLGTTRGKDPDVRAVLIEMYRRRFKKEPIGTSRLPGPLYAVTGHAWQALAAGVAWQIRNGVQGWETIEREKPKKKKSVKKERTLL